MASFVFFKGQSAYDVISNRVDVDARLLRARGHEVHSFADWADPDLIPRLQACDLAIGYQGWGLTLTTSRQQRLLQVLPVRFAAVFGDHPVYHLARMQGLGPRHTSFFASRAQLAFAKDFLAAPGDVQPFPSTADEVSPFDWSQRDLDVLLVGSARDPDRSLAQRVKNAGLHDIVRRGYHSWRHEHGATGDTFFLFIKLFGNDLAKRMGGLDKMLALAAEFDLYCRNAYRNELVSALAGRPITLVGDGWREVDVRLHPDTRVLGDTPREAMRDLRRRTKLTINLTPPHFDFHERIIDFAADGAAVMTSETPWLSEAFAFGEELIATPTADAFTEGLPDLVADPDRWEPVARAGWERVAADFSSSSRLSIFEGLLEAPKALGALETASRVNSQTSNA